MRQVAPQKPRTESFLHQLQSFYGTFKAVAPEENICFDLSKVGWVTPLMLLPIAAHIYETSSDFIPPDSTDVLDYMNYVKFPDGVDSVNALQRFKKYIPVSLVKEGQRPEDRNEILYCFLNLIYKTIGAVPGTKTALFYSPIELVGNVFEHSGKDYGFIFGQIYPKKKYLDVCILDRGRGLAASFKDEKGIVVSHLDAINHAMSGYSTKPGTDRGYGVHTSRKMICEGLKGEFTLITGNACLFSTSKRHEIFELPNFDWQGVVLAYRIPFPSGPIEHQRYIE